MRLLVTDRFRRAYADLNPPDREQVRKVLRTMAEDLRHPGLRVKRIKGTQGIWEARAGRAIRITFETEEDAIILRNVGRHDEVLGRP